MPFKGRVRMGTGGRWGWRVGWGGERKRGWGEKDDAPPQIWIRATGKEIYALSWLYYLINSAISKTILFMFHLPHQK